MLELKPSEFHRVASLFGGLPYAPSIPNSVIAGIGYGRVLVDDAARPTAALVYNNGACTLGGRADDAVFAEQACQWLLEYHGSDYFILFAFPKAWEDVLDRALVTGVRKRQRFDFDFSPSTFALLNGWENTIPAGFDLRRINDALMQQIRDETNPYSRSYWRSARDFERHGLGFCLVHQDAIVSMCYTAFAWHDHHDIDILTAERYRQKGLGTVVACAFIDHCLKHDLVPNWDCWTHNRPSVVLAKKLGFEPRIVVTTYHGVQS